MSRVVCISHNMENYCKRIDKEKSLDLKSNPNICECSNKHPSDCLFDDTSTGIAPRAGTVPSGKSPGVSHRGVTGVAPGVPPSVDGVFSRGFSRSPHSPGVNVSIGQNIYPPASHAPSCTLIPKTMLIPLLLPFPLLHLSILLSLFFHLLWVPLWFCPTPVINAAAAPSGLIVNPLVPDALIWSGVPHAPILLVYLGFQSAPIPSHAQWSTCSHSTCPLLNPPILGVNPDITPSIL